MAPKSPFKILFSPIQLLKCLGAGSNPDHYLVMMLKIHHDNFEPPVIIYKHFIAPEKLEADKC